MVFEPDLEEYLSLKSPATARVYSCGFKRFLEYYRDKYGEDANFRHFLLRIQAEFQKPLLEQEHIIEKEISEFIHFLKKKGLSGNGIRLYFAALQNYMDYKHIKLSMKFLDIPPPTAKRDGNKKVNRKHKWTIEQIKQFVDVAPTYRERAIIMCMFQSGLAVNEICRLNYEDVQDELEADILPICLDLIRQKTKAEFKTFFGRDAVKYLKLYLATRKDLKPKSPLFVQDRLRDGKEVRLNPTIIEQSFADITKSLPFIKQNGKGNYNPARPHSLRAAFNSRLTGRINDDLREFWMGHEIGGVKMAYLNMPIDEMRKHYVTAEQYLKIEMTSEEEKEEKAAITRSITPEMKEKIEELEQTLGQKVITISALEKRVASLEKLYDKFFEMKPEAVWNLMQAIEREHEDREHEHEHREWKEQLKQTKDSWKEEKKKKPAKS
jgi:integrase